MLAVSASRDNGTTVHFQMAPEFLLHTGHKKCAWKCHCQKQVENFCEIRVDKRPCIAKMTYPARASATPSAPLWRYDGRSDGHDKFRIKITNPNPNGHL